MTHPFSAIVQTADAGRRLVGNAVWLPDGRLATAAHCLRPSGFGLVGLCSGLEWFAAEIEGIDQENDFATLRAPSDGFGRRQFEWIRDRSKRIPPADRGYFIGEQFEVHLYSRDLGWLPGSAKVVTEKRRTQLMFNVPCQLRPGISGSPVVDERHNLVTVLTHVVQPYGCVAVGPLSQRNDHIRDDNKGDAS